MKNRCEMCRNYIYGDMWCEVKEATIEPHEVCDKFSNRVKVQQLPWLDAQYQGEGPTSMSVLEHSLTNTDFYILPVESKGFSIYVNGSQVESLGDYYPTIEEAKAAAQAHFEQIVLSYLE